ncbi:MFS transporter [Paenibacillus thermotolerans]|uniref:MFS transporter n=1 Tax=Paenibacillus thermotolerans TaxID=3027807 RepID=UPI00236813D5|nr:MULTISPECIES: MFS transporter [unclassified Paenibacillus]
MGLPHIIQWKRPTPGGVRIPPEKRLSKEAATTIAIHSCYQLGASMSGVFLNLYLWRLTESLFINGLYTLLTYVIGPFAFAFAGKFAKTRDRLFTYRLGIGSTALFYFFVIVAGERVVDYFYLFALLSGISAGFYWLGYLTLMYDVSTDDNRIRYLGLNSIAFNLAGLIGPAFAGFLISRSGGLQGYMIVFTLAFFMFLLTTVGSFRLKSVGTHHKSYYLRMLPLLYRKNKPFRHGLYGWLFIGMYQGLMLFLPNILLYAVLEKEDLVGYAGGLLLALTVTTSYLLSRFGRGELAKRYIMVAAVSFTSGALILLVFGVHVWSVLLFAVSFFGFTPLLVNSFSAYHYRLVGQLPLKGNLRIETIVARESFINAGRVLGLLFLIMLSADIYSRWLGAVIVAASLMQFHFAWVIKPEGKPEESAG